MYFPHHNHPFFLFLNKYIKKTLKLVTRYLHSVSSGGRFGLNTDWKMYLYHINLKACYTLKPIFHCDAKYLASGVGVGQGPRCQNFALEIPTCWYILALPNAQFCVTPDAKP